jgi:hypothetical protein
MNLCEGCLWNLNENEELYELFKDFEVAGDIGREILLQLGVDYYSMKMFTLRQDS